MTGSEGDSTVAYGVVGSFPKPPTSDCVRCNTTIARAFLGIL